MAFSFCRSPLLRPRRLPGWGDETEGADEGADHLFRLRLRGFFVDLTHFFRRISVYIAHFFFDNLTGIARYEKIATIFRINRIEMGHRIWNGH